jgi:hypothetical protein
MSEELTNEFQARVRITASWDDGLASWTPSEEDVQELEDIDDGQDGGHQWDDPLEHDSPEAMDSPLDYDTREAMQEVQPCLPGMGQPVQQWLPLWRLAVKPRGRTSCTPVPVEPSADLAPDVVSVETPVAPRGIDWVEAVFAGLGRLLRPA